MLSNKVICYIGGGVVSVSHDAVKTTAFFGKIINEIGSHFESLILVVPTVERVDAHDCLLKKNIIVKSVPIGGSALGNIMVAARWRPVINSAIAASDYVFIRGLFTPALGYIYRSCKKGNKPLLHWLIGNPKALLSSHRRSSIYKDSLRKIYTNIWCRYVDYLHNRSNGLAGYICNGSEIYKEFSKRNSWIVTSSTLTYKDYYLRHDTCHKKPVVVGTLCYLRPEKGIEYLVESLRWIEERDLEIKLYGGFGKYTEYQNRILKLASTISGGDKIKFMGEVKSADVPLVMREIDVFVLPTLSEGTPRVILEAQANCAPVISTNVGGIPDMVINEHSGLLVPSKSPRALADAINTIIKDGDERRKIVRNGYEVARKNNLNSFVAGIVQKYTALESG